MPHGHWRATTLTAAKGLDGVPPSACLVSGGATNTSSFEDNLGRCLVPMLRAGDIVVMDNLGCHITAQVAELIAHGRPVVRYLAAYIADYNPIEQLSIMLKAWLRSGPPGRWIA